MILQQRWMIELIEIKLFNIDMASLFSNFFKRVIRVKIEGDINQKLYILMKDRSDKISSGLKKAHSYQPQAIIVSINSQKGSLAQAKYITDALRQYSLKKNAPIYCFAEDVCLSSANVILTSGVKCYANSMSLLGDFNYMWSSMWFKKFSDKYNIRQEFIHAGENKIKFNPFEDIKPDSQKWMQNHLYMSEHDLKVTVINNRSTHFQKNNLQKQDLQDKVFGKRVIEPEEAARHGLIDGIMNADDLIRQKFDGVKQFHLAKKRSHNRFGDALAKLNVVS